MDSQKIYDFAVSRNITARKACALLGLDPGTLHGVSKTEAYKDMIRKKIYLADTTERYKASKREETRQRQKEKSESTFVCPCGCNTKGEYCKKGYMEWGREYADLAEPKKDEILTSVYVGLT